MSQDRSEDQYRGIPLPYLREVRQSKGLSQRELGELARVSRVRFTASRLGCGEPTQAR